jgi:hypothetical protein
MRIRTNYTHAGKSRTREDGVYVDATKDLATEEVEVSFVNVFGRITSLRMSADEARDIARKISEAADGRFTFTARAFE